MPVLFGAESFVILFAVYKRADENIHDHNFGLFVWV